MRIPKNLGFGIIHALFSNLFMSLIYGDFFTALSPRLYRRRLKKVRRLQETATRQLAKKEKIRVVFFLQSPSIWHYDRIYWRMKEDKRFEPTVVISPYGTNMNRNKRHLAVGIEKTIKFAQAQGYDYISTLDEHGHWVNIRKTIDPDIVFYCEPYKSSRPQYHIYRFQDKLTLYSPYATYTLANYDSCYNLTFHNLVWRNLQENDYFYEMSCEYSLCKGDNSVVVGMLPVEKILDPNYQPIDVWKPQPTAKKRIIWAPHHSMGHGLNLSTFLIYYENMREMATKYSDVLQMAFKPHPGLKNKLLRLWGEEKTEEYYNWWASQENTQLEDGEYIDLFKTSDAMIHDSGSFRVHYLSTLKPALYLMSDSKVYEDCNPFGRQCIDMHYQASNWEEIINFVQDVVLQGNDSMLPQRQAFYNQHLALKDNVLPSQKTIDIILEALDKAPSH